jgi:hypothetical protein
MSFLQTVSNLHLLLSYFPNLDAVWDAIGNLAAVCTTTAVVELASIGSNSNGNCALGTDALKIDASIFPYSKSCQLSHIRKKVSNQFNFGLR